VDIIDQTLLPHQFKIRTLENVESAAEAIATMRVRGAPLIGATAAYGVALAMHEDPSDESLASACRSLIKTRPTASNLRWAVERMRGVLAEWGPEKRESLAYRAASEICDEDVAINDAIGDNGLNLIQDLWTNRPSNRRTFHILTHCNAGWLATVDWGTALAPIFKAHDAGIPVHVWVDETRPRNQGASLTSWELKAHGIPHDVIVDNAGGHLMQRGKVDMLLTGTDRTTRCGDVCNKIGTYLKALAARDNRVPFYVALPGPTIDWSISDGISGIPIEERDGSEVSTISGRLENGEIAAVQLLPDQVSVRNFAFDVTPAKLVTGLITERGVCAASEDGLQFLYPEQVRESA
ncbi:MAG: S-methyl-5-thioribose-1-phosphate isomerase, partial [Xanthomonadales bacterium]|nr:S-methyl-5-thioribose-1-phosphate isomerase [Xanthomonadales bacterium]